MGESFPVVSLFNEFPNTGNDHSAREDRFEVPSRHLENEAQGCGHSCDQSCSTFNASASFILFRVVWGDFKLYYQLALYAGRLRIITINVCNMYKFQEMSCGCENQMSRSNQE